MIHTDHIDTQNKQVLIHLVRYGNITSIQAIRLYGITRLASIIDRLKHRGSLIASVTEYDQSNKSRHWAKYELIKTK